MNFKHNNYYTMIDENLTWIWKHDYMNDTQIWDKGSIFIDDDGDINVYKIGQNCLVDLADEDDTVIFREATDSEIKMLEEACSNIPNL